MALFGRESPQDQARAASYAAWFARQHPLALPSLLLSAFSLSHGGVLLLDELAGIVRGVVALSQIRRARQSPSRAIIAMRTEGRWLAVAGIVVGVLSLILAVVFYTMRPRG